MTQPHDNLFKDVFGDPEVAAEHLRGALPAEVLAWVDLDTLERVERSFVDGELGVQHADLLFTVCLRSGGEALVYLLFEHQSTPDPMMPYRLMVYIVRIWAHWLKTHTDAKRLPLVYPLVLYQGQRAWNAPPDLADLIDLPEEAAAVFAEALPHLRYDLADLSQVPDEDLMSGALLSWVKLLMKHAWDEDLPDRLPGWMEVFRRIMAAGSGLRALELTARYIYEVNDADRAAEVIRQIAGEVLGPGNEEYIMSLANRLRAEGFERGVKEGIEQGLERGIEQGIEQGRRRQAQVLLSLLERRFGPLTDSVRERVLQADPDKLTTWTDRILTASTVDALLDR
ncbi:MAG: Rpn family recombination-promoting nuclease/putative transposase [Alphaproteobacteria bacterium]|nr:Rpn family recombination-promoting nuclease/putative transposase [Alphaproteobacteria bacterium]